jgi:bacterioferritin-associated ferredoxin
MTGRSRPVTPNTVRYRSFAMCLCRGLSDHLRRAAIETGPDVPRNVATVIDAGPDQAKVMSKERELAVAPINELSGASTTFTIDGAGILSKTKATRLDRSVAAGNDRHDVGRPTFEDFPAPSCELLRKLSSLLRFGRPFEYREIPTRLRSYSTFR